MSVHLSFRSVKNYLPNEFVQKVQRKNLSLYEGILIYL
jgi:hypothetical protein